MKQVKEIIISNHSIIAFFLLVIFSSLFRLTHLSLIEFKSDEAINIYLASQPVFGHPFAPGGTVSSIGILNPPLFNYLLFPIVFFTRNPQIISFLIGLINVLAIGFFFIIIRQYYGLAVAWLTTLFLAFSPWAILYSRKIWMQNFLIPFFVIFFLAYHKIVAGKRMPYWIVLTAFSLFLMQLHQASIFFIAIVAVFLTVQKVKIDFRYIIVGLFIGLLPLIHYFTYEIKNMCPDCQTLLTSRNRFSIERSLEIFKRPFQITGQGNFNYVIGVSDMIAFKDQHPLIYRARYILYATYLLLPFGIIIAIKKYNILRPFVFATIVLPTLYYFFKFEPFMHYFIIVIPLLFLFISCGIAYMFKKNQIVKTIAFTITLLFIIVSILFNYAFFSLIEKREYLGGDYGATYKQQKKEINGKMIRYRDLKNPEEVLLASYIPLRFMYGFMPMSRMLYPGKKSEAEIRKLEDTLRDKPEDVRIKHELFAALTQTPPTQETVEFLFHKKAIIPAYEEIYEENHGYFISKNFLKKYFSKKLGIDFYYPEHWRVEENDHGIAIESDDATTTIERQGSSSFNIEKLSSNERKWDYEETLETDDKELTIVLCTTADLKICGFSFYPLFVHNEPFIMFNDINAPTVFLSDRKRFAERKETLLRLLRSIRPA